MMHFWPRASYFVTNQIATLVKDGGTPARILALQEAFESPDWCQAVAALDCMSCVCKGLSALRLSRVGP